MSATDAADEMKALLQRYMRHVYHGTAESGCYLGHRLRDAEMAGPHRRIPPYMQPGDADRLRAIAAEIGLWDGTGTPHDVFPSPIDAPDEDPS